MSEIVNMAGVVRVHAQQRGEQIALIEGDRQLTWSQLHGRAAQMAQALSAAGVGAGDRVAFLDKNCIEHFEVFFGAAMLNAVCVDVNWRLAAPEVQFIVDDAEAKVLVVGPEFVSMLDEIAADLPTVTTFVSIGAPSAHSTEYEAWIASFDAVDPGVESGADDTAFQLYSSGTTGRPKGVMLSNSNFFSLLPMAKDIWDLDADSINLVAMPLFHIGGGGWACAGMYEGCTSVIFRELDPAALISTIEEHRITHAFLVPAVLQFMLMVPGVEDGDYSSLKVFVYGASPISEEVLSKCVEMFKPCKFWQAYGLTETTGAVVNLPPEDHADSPNKHRLRSCGVAGPGVELQIIGDDGTTVLPAGEVGEIWIRSPQVMTGYWKMPEETERAVSPDGWFKSGDAGYLDDDGYLFIHDRVKDMIVSGGENVYPAEVENVLMKHEAVADVAVIGVPHEKWGETAKAMVVVDPGYAGDDATAESILTFAKSQLATFKCPTSIDWMDVLPRNPSGKVLKKDLREPFWEGHERRVG